MKPVYCATNRWETVFLLVMALFLQGCSDDNGSECGVKVRFRYTKNATREDKLESELHKLNLFIFDSKGIFVGNCESQPGLLPNGYTMDLPLLSGKYNVVVWGNSDQEYDLSPVVPGKTTIREAILTLKSELKKNNTVETALSTSLFYGALIDVHFQADTRMSRVYTVDLAKNTKRITVVVTGLPMDENDLDAFERKYDVMIPSRNDSLSFTDNRTTASNVLQYLPRSTFNTRGWVSDFVLIREMEDASTHSHLIITSREADGSVRCLLDRDLIEMLLTKVDLAEFAVTDHFEIQVDFDQSMQATIQIDGWSDDPIHTGV